MLEYDNSQLQKGLRRRRELAMTHIYRRQCFYVVPNSSVFVLQEKCARHPQCQWEACLNRWWAPIIDAIKVDSWEVCPFTR